MIFWLAGSIGSLFSGFLQAAAYTNLNGVGGFSGWRWLFIIDGIITVPLALAGFIFFPNLPQSGEKTWWISDAEDELSVRRMKAIGRAGKEPWSKKKAKRILLSWHTYLLREYLETLLLCESRMLTINCSTTLCCLEQWRSSG
jgi:MFS family permease